MGIEVACADKRFDRWLEQRRFHYSVVLLSRASNVQRFHGHLKRTQPQARRIYDIEALAFRRVEHEDSDKAKLLRARAGGSTRRTSSSASRTTRRVRARANERTGARPSDLHGRHCVPPGFDERDGAVFFGGFLAGSGGPNEDAAVRLVEELMPILWETMPELELEIIGANPTAAVARAPGFAGRRGRLRARSGGAPITGHGSTFTRSVLAPESSC